MLEKAKRSLLRNVPKAELDSKTVYEAAIQGDELAKEIFEFTGKILGLALANFVMFSSPEAIILFGGLTKAGDLILKPTREHMEANLIQVFQNKVKILVSHLKEADAAILGASALVSGYEPLDQYSIFNTEQLMIKGTLKCSLEVSVLNVPC